MRPYPHHYVVQSASTPDGRAEHVCPISNSLVAERRLAATVSVG